MKPRLALLTAAGILAACAALSTRALAQSIRLGDVAAGGDGTGTAPAVNTGVDERTGRFTTDYFDGPVSMGGALDDGLNPSPVPDSPYVDSVFFIEPGLPGTGIISQVITQSGVRFDFFQTSDGTGTSRNYILKDRNGGVSTPGIQVGGIAIPTGSAVGIHASMGITFDLDALRARHGADRIGCFKAFWGLDGCDTGDVNLYAILSSDAGVIAGSFRTFRAVGSVGEWVEMEIPATVRYLTLATGTNNGGVCGDGTFGDAKITCSPCPLPSFTALDSVEPRMVSTRGGTEVTFVGQNLDPGFLYLLGGQPVTGVIPVDALRTSVRGIAPALVAGRYDAQVAVPTGGGFLACLKDAVEAVAEPPPTITSVEPPDVRRDGKTSISIHGEKFSTATRIRLGARDLTNPSFVSPWLITGNAPALGPLEPDGPRDVVAEDPAGNAVLPGGVVYFAPVAVRLQQVTPSLVSTPGGTPVELTGQGFVSGMVVRLGGVTIQALTLVSPTSIRVNSPPLPAGFHPAEIIDAEGDVLARLDRAIEAGPPLTLTSAEPHDVERDGSTPISIHGENFRAETRIRIGSRDLVGPRLVSPSLITGDAPALNPVEPDGPRYVTAEDSRGASSLADGLEYVSPPAFFRGDINSDAKLDLADVIFSLNFLFRGGPEPACLDAADTNDDGELDISDPVRLLFYLFAGADPPPQYDMAHPRPDPTVDALDCQAPALPPKSKGLWGFADLHAHPASHLAFGADSNGNFGIFWGKPGGNLATALATLPTDLASCATDVHVPVLDLDPVRHGTRGALITQLNSVTGHPHGGHGSSDFDAWPHAQSILHQQMHVTAIKRAHDAGLRLLFASVTDNQMLARLWNIGFNLLGNNLSPSPGFDFNRASAQLDFINALAQANASWMEVVTTPAQARAAIGAGKLAVVLSLEMDQLASDEVLALVKDKGVRHVIPIHLVNNGFGGTAVYNDAFNVSNRFHNGEYLRVEGAPVIQYRLAWPMRLTSKIQFLSFFFGIPSTFGALQPELIDRAELCQLAYEPCPEAPNASAVPLDQGHRNVRGLNAPELQKLMKAGLMLDLAHMSEKSMDDALSLAEKLSYPLMNSHTSFRNPKIPDAFSGGKPKRRVTSERDMTFDQAKRLAALGGVVGAGTEGRLEPMSLARFEFHPDALLQPATPSLVLSLTKAGTLPLIASVTSLEVTVKIGDYGPNWNINHAFALVDLKNVVQGLAVPLNPNAQWAPHSTHSVTVPLPAGTLLNDLVAFGIQSGVPNGFPPVWSVDTITVSAVGPLGRQVVMFREGRPFRAFSSNYLNWMGSIDLSPPPAPWVVVKRVKLTLETGGDDLRGGDDNAWAEVRRRDTVSRRLMVNARQGWAGNSTHGASIDMPPNTHIGDLEVITLDTTFGGGFDGDNWNLQSIKIEAEDPNGATTLLLNADGRPWFRFTGEEKHKVAWQAPPEVSDLTAEAVFLRLTVVSGNDGLDGSNTATAAIALANQQTTSINFSLGGALEPFSAYRRIIPLPPGTRRGDLQTLTLAVNPNVGDVWRIGLVLLEVIADPAALFLEDYNEVLGLMGGVPTALGTDINGFASQLPFSGAVFDYPLHAPHNHAPANLKVQVPFIPQSTLGSKTFDFRVDGLAHYGMLAELVQALDTMPGGPAALDKLYSSAESAIRMWEACEAAKQFVP